jgi:hypothetical protein
LLAVFGATFQFEDLIKKTVLSVTNVAGIIWNRFGSATEEPDTKIPAHLIN